MIPHSQTRANAKSPEILEAEKADTPEMSDIELRPALTMDCKVKKLETTPESFHVS